MEPVEQVDEKGLASVAEFGPLQHKGASSSHTTGIVLPLASPRTFSLICAGASFLHPAGPMIGPTLLVAYCVEAISIHIVSLK